MEDARGGYVSIGLYRYVTDAAAEFLDDLQQQGRYARDVY